jgi:substrate import-associated zinc metallohydrolase lipoprotein
LYPAKLEYVKPALEMVQKVWIQSYVDVAGKEFVNKIRPGRFLLAGGYALNDDGTRTLGLASGGVQVTLYEVDFLHQEVESARQFIHTIQHEYVHIINQDTPFDELEFGAKSFADYNSLWYLLDIDLQDNGFTIDTYGNVLGFVTGYARSNIMEDFAETASYLLSHKPEEYQAMLAKVRSYENMTPAEREAIGLTTEFYKEGGADIIERKVGLVKAYYNALGIDFDELARVANKNADESPMLNPGGQNIMNNVIYGIRNTQLVGKNSIIRYCQGHADVSEITLTNK